MKVTVRYSADAGLRPFYLTVANQIKTTHPDALLEKRILPPVGSDAGGADAIFEVVVDGKTVIGKKKTKILRLGDRKLSGGGEDDDADNGKDEGSNAKSGGDTTTPDIAGGRTIFVSMEKLDHEMNKARKRRRPNTMYKNKEDALRGGSGNGIMMGNSTGVGDDPSDTRSVSLSSEMTDAVMRLERLKAMSTGTKS